MIMADERGRRADKPAYAEEERMCSAGLPAKGPARAKAGAAVCWSQRKARPHPLTNSLAVAVLLDTGDLLCPLPTK